MSFIREVLDSWAVVVKGNPRKATDVPVGTAT